jgi:hypothetical protein
MQKPAERIKVHGRVYVRASQHTQADAVPEVITFRGATYRKAFQLNPHYSPYGDRPTKKSPVAPPAQPVVKKVETERLREELFSALDVLVKKLIGMAEDRVQIVEPFGQLGRLHPRMIEPLSPGLEKAFRKLRDAGKQFYQLRRTLSKSLGYQYPSNLPATRMQQEAPQSMYASVEIQAAIKALNVAAACTDAEWTEILQAYRHA